MAKKVKKYLKSPYSSKTGNGNAVYYNDDAVKKADKHETGEKTNPLHPADHFERSGMTIYILQ